MTEEKCKKWLLGTALRYAPCSPEPSVSLGINMCTYNDEEKVVLAIESSKYKWRTIDGILDETKISRSRFQEVYEKSPRIVKARKPNESGQALYSTRKKLDDESTTLEKIGARILNRVSME